MFEFLLIDLDDTILDFHKAERIAVAVTLEAFGLTPDETILARYHAINKAHWEMLERGELTRNQVRMHRFEALFAEFGKTVDSAACGAFYESRLAIGHYFLPGAKEALEQLARKYRLFLVSNGNAHVQTGRLASADIGSFFEKIFISQEVGADKPSEEFFSRCFAQIPGFARERAMIVGDSLTSDILGGLRAGIKTCWINPEHAPGRPDIRPDYELERLSELDSLLESL